MKLKGKVIHVFLARDYRSTQERPGWIVMDFYLKAHLELNDRGEFMVDELVDERTEGELVEQKISIFRKNWDRMPKEGNTVTMELRWEND